MNFCLDIDYRDRSGHKIYHYCYCNKKQIRLPKHLEQKHKSENLVAEALSYPRKSIRRNNIWKYIRNKGGYEVNIERFKSSRPIQSSCKLTVNKDEELLSCKFCFGIFKARKPSDHTRNCFMKKQPSKSMERRGSYVKEARMMLSTGISDGHSDFVRRFILPSMRRDECHLIIWSDKLLMTFAAIELEKREP